MNVAEDPDDYRARLEAKLAPQRIRATLAFAGLYQLTHEMIKRSVIDDVKGFFGYSTLSGEGTWLYGESGKTDYEKSVLARIPRNPFKASLLWLEEGEAITGAQVERLDAIYTHRHDLTHELGKYIVDVDFEPDVEQFHDALEIMRDISRFWTQIEKDIGTFEEHRDSDIDDVTPGNLLVLQMCVQAYIEGLPRGHDGGQQE